MDGADRPHDRTAVATRSLAVLAIVSIGLYAAIAWLSWQFDYHAAGVDRPILAVLGLFAVAFALYLIAIRIAAAGSGNLKLVVVAAIGFRIVMLFSLPIQEVDIYRYLWDGAVSVSGVSPYQYSPQQVQDAAFSTTDDPELQRLIAVLDREPPLAEILARVHFPELPTIYPPTSQVVFAASEITTPAGASLLARLFIMKAWLIGFDIATLLVVIGLLRARGRSADLCVIYAWCPLLMKEVAGSGHLDAVAVFFTALSIYLAVRLLKRDAATVKPSDLGLAGVAITLALAIGAKLYPVVLAPLMVLVVARRFGWQHLLMPGAVLAVGTLLLLWPMMPRDAEVAEPIVSPVAENSGGSMPEPIEVISIAPPSPPATDPSLGVATFLKRWEMNDFLFLILIENLKPTSELPADRVAWFSIVPDAVRESVRETAQQSMGIEAAEAPFFVARAITAVAFLLVAIGLAWRVSSAADVALFCETVFLTLAWFWLLCPTQNPWYWSWALPFLPFARGRAWLAISGLVLVYYLRFWLDYHHADTTVLGTRYAGVAFYDFVVTWLEFAPWMAFLAIDAWRRPKRPASPSLNAG
ncbi:hypothetical protein [Rosistilla oblonga]|uniref:hypothetical protein n=1 Tax=Rosistilla oblonga TaxID=2527990 RepID=UPI003A96E49D